MAEIKLVSPLWGATCNGHGFLYLERVITACQALTNAGLDERV